MTDPTPRHRLDGPYAIKIVAPAIEGIEVPGMWWGQYLMTYDPEAKGGRGVATTTPDLAEAMHFDSVSQAFARYYAVPKNLSWRPDGRLNRPLTAFTIEIVKIDIVEGTAREHHQKG
jgi:hypothetical protein